MLEKLVIELESENRARFHLIASLARRCVSQCVMGRRRPHGGLGASDSPPPGACRGRSSPLQGPLKVEAAPRWRIYAPRWRVGGQGGGSKVKGGGSIGSWGVYRRAGGSIVELAGLSSNWRVYPRTGG